MPARGESADVVEFRQAVKRALAACENVLTERGGVAACGALSREYDRLLVGLFGEVAGERPGVALVATGGLGRREVWPGSDLDLILLSRDAGADDLSQLAEQLVHPLWDARLRVGHSVQTPQAAATLSATDLPTATSLLDARLVCGDRALFEELEKSARAAIAPAGDTSSFVSALQDEMRRRHQRFGDSLYLLEPNLKNGIGGLRDLATAIWAGQVRFGARNIKALTATGHLRARQAKVLLEAREFLFGLRWRLRLAGGRRNDQLTFELQEQIAPELCPDAAPGEGDLRSAVAPAVEELMREFYLHARGVVQVAERLLEAAAAPNRRRRPSIAGVDGSLLLFNRTLAVRDPDVFRRRPSELVRLFTVALDLGVPVYWHTLELAAEATAAVGDALVGDAEASRHFLSLLCDLRDTGQPSLLEQMHSIGVLSAIIPEFAPCTARVQHDLYHVYTVDQHSLYAVAMLKRLANSARAGGAAGSDDLSPEVTGAMAAVTEPEPLYLATLLHDVGKPLGKGHSESGAKIARAVGARFGMAGAHIDRAEFLVRQHLTMSHLSQRRDLKDPDVIRRFAERVGDASTLRALYLLTRCDTAMTSPGNLSVWKDKLLTELFTRTLDHFRGDADSAKSGIAVARERLRRRLSKSGPLSAAIDEVVAGLGDHVVTSFTERQLARLLRLDQTRQQTGDQVATAVRHFAQKGHSELAVVAPDSPGVLAAITAVLAARRISVEAAVIGRRSGDPAVALDIFFVRGQAGDAIEVDDPRWFRCEADLAAVFSAADPRAKAAEIFASRERSRLPDRVTPEVPTTIDIHDDESASFTVVDIMTRDRPGLLYRLTSAIADLSLDIAVAKVSTEGERAIDSFYVEDRAGGGGKLPEARSQQLGEALLAALEEPE